MPNLLVIKEFIRLGSKYTMYEQSVRVVKEGTVLTIEHAES